MVFIIAGVPFARWFSPSMAVGKYKTSYQTQLAYCDALFSWHIQYYTVYTGLYIMLDGYNMICALAHRNTVICTDAALIICDYL